MGWISCAVWQVHSSKMAPRILIFSIAMGVDYSFYVKSIATYAPQFSRYNNSAIVYYLPPCIFRPSSSSGSYSSHTPGIAKDLLWARQEQLGCGAAVMQRAPHSENFTKATSVINKEPIFKMHFKVSMSCNILEIKSDLKNIVQKLV